MGERKIRSLIVTVLGHVDHGKTTLLDKIRGTAVALREPGSITQHIGATFIPSDILLAICDELVEKFNVKVEIPGFLVIDTPGHELFTNLRRRGGAIADLAILVIDIMSGVQPQTVESINILRDKRTPFVIAANKVDLLRGWKKSEKGNVFEGLREQSELTKKLFEEKFYALITQLSELGFDSDIYFNIDDFRKKLAVVPVSAKTGDGLPDLILVMLGLAQRFMMERLTVLSEKGRGTVMEVKEEPGIGKTVDAIVYEGRVKVGDLVVIGTLNGALVTRVKGLFLPMPLDEMRAPRSKFKPVSEVEGAVGVKMFFHESRGLAAGVPFQVVLDMEEAKRVVKEVEAEIREILIKTDKVGVIVKADSLGSLEAITTYLEKKRIPIRLADVGDVSRKDVVEASIVREKEEKYACILGFNVKVLSDAEEEARVQGLPVIVDNIIYQLVEKYEEFLSETEERLRKEKLRKLNLPVKIKLLKEYIFRRSKPAIIGVEVIGGTLRPGMPLMKENGSRVGCVLQVQSEGKPVSAAVKGERVAISMKEPVIGRQLKGDETLYTDIPFNKIFVFEKEIWGELTEEEKEVLKDIKAIKARKLMGGVGNG